MFSNNCEFALPMVGEDVELDVLFFVALEALEMDGCSSGSYGRCLVMA